MVKSCDEMKQWAALHYAVFNNNIYVCDQLANLELKEKRFRHGMLECL